MHKLFWIALGLTVTLCAQGQTRVYKWVDENGVVHFTPRPPPNQEAESMQVSTGPSVDPAAANEEEKPSGPLYAEPEAPDNSKVRAENARRLCEKGRSMIAQIEPRPRVFRVDKDGNRSYLADDERLRLLDEARGLVRENC